MYPDTTQEFFNSMMKCLVTTLLSSDLLESCAHRTDVPERGDESCLDLEPPNRQPTELPMFQIPIPLPPPEVYVKAVLVRARNCAEGARLLVNTVKL
jgi:hypothetical protein